MTTCAQFFSCGTPAPELPWCGTGEDFETLHPEQLLKLSRCLGENLGGEDEDVAGGNVPMRGRDDEEEVGEVDQPGLVQRDWGAFECLHHVNNDDTMMTLH